MNGHGTAEAVARFYAGLLGGGELDGVRLVSQEMVVEMTRGELTARDVLLDEERTWGLGVWVDTDGFGMGGIGRLPGNGRSGPWCRPGVRHPPPRRPRAGRGDGCCLALGLALARSRSARSTGAGELDA